MYAFVHIRQGGDPARRGWSSPFISLFDRGEQMTWEERIVDGFVFAGPAQVKDAQEDVQRIGQLEEKLNYANLDAVAMVYIKSIQNGLFQTVVGYSYLKRLQLYLSEKNYQKIDFDKYPIPAYLNQEAAAGEMETKSSQGGPKATFSGKNSQTEQKLKTSVFLNILLIAAIIALFVITINGENVNIINYRYKIENEYSQWQKQLEEREAAVRDRERALEMIE